MVFSFTNAPKLTAADMGVPDYANALRKGFQTAADVYKPSTASSELLAKMLQNKINQPKAEDAQGWYNLQKQALSDAHGMSGLNLDLLRQKISQGKYEQDLNNQLFGNGNKAPAYEESDNSSNAGVTAGGPGANYGEPTVANTFPGRTGKPTAFQQAEENDRPAYAQNIENSLKSPTVQALGNPNMYHVDELIDSDPRAAAALKKRGYEKKVTPHYDARTGVTSVVTQYPSGKVTVSASGGNTKSGSTPLTTKTISTLQLQKQAIPQLKKVIDDLIAAPSPFEPEGPFGIGKIYRANDRAKHQALVDLGRDIFVKAKGINATDATLGTAKNVLDRRTGESDNAYHKRLLTFKDTLNNDEQDVDSALGGKSSASSKQKELTYNPATGRLE